MSDPHDMHLTPKKEEKAEDYPIGDSVLLDLLRYSSDSIAIRRELKNVDLNQPILNERSMSTTYLYEAVRENNLTAVRVLLNNGADPNYVNNNLTHDCVLWDLQYCDMENDDPGIRFQIAKEFFRHGADPNIVPEAGEESLYDYVTFKVFNDSPGYDWDYLLDFYLLLIAYGGGGLGYPKPEFIKEIDKDKIDNYRLAFERCDDGYHIAGYILSPDGEKIGRL